jgi:tetratricopeptide (TPR) repeat protein
MAVLGAALDAARRGQGGTVFILGEAGVGKSRLAREIQTRARDQGVRTLRGRAVEGSIGPYRPVAEALLSALRVSGLPDVPELRPFQPILGRLIPGWRQEDGSSQGVSAGSSYVAVDDSTVLLGEAILRLLRVLGACHGCLIALEDLHWADADTLAVVEYLTDNLQTEPILLLATVRSDERSPALARVRAMAARRAGQLLELPRLDHASVAEMARVCLDVTVCPQPIMDLLVSATEGLPFLVEELLAAWIGSGALTRDAGRWEIAPELARAITPITFVGTVNRRLATLGDKTRRLLLIAAILGRYFDWMLLPAATGLDEPDVLLRLREAVDAQLVTVDDQGSLLAGIPGAGGIPKPQTIFRFRHALTRAAILDGLLPPERAALSARLLALVESLHPDLLGEWCDLAAGLAAGAGNTQRAAQLLLESGRRSLERGALATAESTLDRARALIPPHAGMAGEVDDALMEALSLAGKWERVFQVGERLLSARETPEIHLRMARAALAAGHREDAARHLDQARRLGTQEPAGLQARLDALAAHLAIERGRRDEAAAFARSALQGAEQAALPEVACEALEALGRCARVTDLDHAKSAFERARHRRGEWAHRLAHQGSARAGHHRHVPRLRNRTARRGARSGDERRRAGDGRHGRGTDRRLPRSAPGAGGDAAGGTSRRNHVSPPPPRSHGGAGAHLPGRRPRQAG